MFSFFFFLFISIKKIFINNNELFEWIQTLSQPRSLSQCSVGLQHLIRRSPIGTRGVSRPCLRVHNILFSPVLFLLFIFYSCIHLCFSNFLILLFFFFFFSIKTNLHQQQWIVWMDTNSFPTPFIVTVFNGATAFNQDISNWNTGSVLYMSYST